jgi:hypothetical protein
MEDITNTILGIVTGLFTAIITVKYTHNEDERLKFNGAIGSLFDEIEYNREKLPKYIVRLNTVKEEWSKNGKIIWINDAELSTGYRGYLYNFFKFDSYNKFMSEGLNSILEHDLDYSLKLFYHNCKQFCADTQSIEENIRAIDNYHREEMGKILMNIIPNNPNVDLFNNPELNSLKERIKRQINSEWDSIGEQYKKIELDFENASQFKFENKERLKIGWITWHLKNRKKTLK